MKQQHKNPRKTLRQFTYELFHRLILALGLTALLALATGAHSSINTPSAEGPNLQAQFIR